MKKVSRMVLLGAAAISFIGCGKEEAMFKGSETKNENPSIGLNVTAKSMETRGVTETDLAKLKSPGFTLFAIFEDSVIIDNKKASLSGSAWNYGDSPVLWPKDSSNHTFKDVSFYAVYDPANTSAEVDTSATDTTTTVKMTGENDVVVAKKTKKGGLDADSIVSLTFNHIYSQVRFVAKLQNPPTGVTCKVKSITTGSLKSTYMYSYKDDTITSNVEDTLISYYSDENGTEIKKVDDTTGIGEYKIYPSIEMVDTIKYEIFKNGVSTEETLTKVVTIPAREKGKKYVYTLLLPLDGSNITINDGDITVTAWEAETFITDEIVADSIRES